jgi:RimJ/RimL family protein N-acetyltransferase
MNVVLREFREPDIQRLDEWAKRIRSENYMSRYRPMNRTVAAHNPEQGLLWFVIHVSGSDVGTIWLERGVQSDEAILAIFLGEESLFGLGIGEKAINMAIEKAQELSSFRRVLLNVRESNTRAIACYKKCGFIPVASGVKQTTNGDEIHYVTMQRRLG